MSRGFTLLEVLVAIAILGLGLTTILSSQVGLFSSAQSAQNLSIAAGLARCRMSETEVELVQAGYPLIDQNDEGPCCNDEDEGSFRCSWKVERIELPQPQELATTGEGEESGLGPLGALADIQKTKGASLGESPSLNSLAGAFSESGGAGAVVPLVMGLVYPDLKPMLEASIRKVTVSVTWKEGKNDRELAVTQFVTNPTQGGLDPNAADAVKGLDGLLGGSP